MAETLGSLCDKLTIVKLKQYHTDDAQKTESLNAQEIQLKAEIDEFIVRALNGDIPVNKLTFNSNKVYKKEGNETRDVSGNIGSIFSMLAQVNCDLWHEQEKVYEFETVPVEEKDKVVKQLAILNLERNKCMNQIDEELKKLVTNKQ
jgi:hypothetical protein